MAEIDTGAGSSSHVETTVTGDVSKTHTFSFSEAFDATPVVAVNHHDPDAAPYMASITSVSTTSVSTVAERYDGAHYDGPRHYIAREA